MKHLRIALISPSALTFLFAMSVAPRTVAFGASSPSPTIVNEIDSMKQCQEAETQRLMTPKHPGMPPLSPLLPSDTQAVILRCRVKIAVDKITRLAGECRSDDECGSADEPPSIEPQPSPSSKGNATPASTPTPEPTLSNNQTVSNRKRAK